MYTAAVWGLKATGDHEEPPGAEGAIRTPPAVGLANIFS